MGWFKRKKKDRDYYDGERDRLRECLKQEKPGTQAYKDLMADIDHLAEQESTERVIHRTVHLDIKKMITGGTIVAGILGWNAYLDREGDMLSANARKNAESVTNSVIRTLTGIKFW